MLSWKDEMMQRERYRDFRREAQRDEFARQMLGRRKGHPRIDKALAKAGTLLVAWGSALMERDESIPVEPHLASSTHT